MLTKADILAVTLLFTHLKPEQQPEYFDISPPGIYKEYDYIIVGGGSAGSVLANRLSAEPSTRVLLLEAGGPEDTVTDVPFFTTVSQGSDIDWAFYTETQANCAFATVKQRDLWIQGKVLGGGSVLNYMIYNRGNRRDYDNWAKGGATGWSYDEVLPYFKKSEDNTNRSLAEEGYHGYGGELTVSSTPFQTPALHAFLKAGKELGYEVNDHNGARQTGFMANQFTVRGKERWSTSKAFVLPISGKKGRKNLHVSIFSKVTKILFDGMRAVGVTFKKNQRKHTVRAAKEIIISAGVINSPKLLMLSGVGPRKHLEEMNIPVVADLPVGENLQDHALAAGSLVHLNESLGEGFTGIRGAIEYYRYNTGPWTLPGGIEGIAFYKTKYADQNDDFPDIEIMLNTGPPASSYTEPFLIGLGLKQEVYDKYILPHRGEPAVNMIPFVTRPKSRGYVKLRSTDPEDPPIIVSGYYTHPDDVKVIVEGLKFVHNITKTKAFAEIGGRVWSEVFPGCEEHEQYSDEYWACLALAFPKTAYHPAGTCRMGSDHRAVIDPRMRVRGGVTNLRVVDTSAIPEMITGHLNAPVIMMAEKAADMILEDNGNVVPDSPRLNYRVRGPSPKGSQQGAHSAAPASTLLQAASWPLLRALVPVLLACLAVS
nr:glucose dehydrogenase [FAD, quinone]-like [Dermacentor andersoni]